VLPDYYLARPPLATGETLAAFVELYDRHLASGAPEIDYRLDVPKWQFLCWLAETCDVLLHGSGNPDIESFEPRLPEDTAEFGNRKAVFAAGDGVWAIFFAILDRTIAYSLVNACFSIRSADGHDTGAVHYYFSVNASALGGGGLGPGAVYVLPRWTFEQQADHDDDGLVVVSRQWASLEPVRPVGRLAVTPDDVPFLAEINGHDVAAVMARATADPDAFPWRD
jgi:hypothetical protein